MWKPTVIQVMTKLPLVALAGASMLFGGLFAARQPILAGSPPSSAADAFAAKPMVSTQQTCGLQMQPAVVNVPVGSSCGLVAPVALTQACGCGLVSPGLSLGGVSNSLVSVRGVGDPVGINVALNGSAGPASVTVNLSGSANPASVTVSFGSSSQPAASTLSTSSSQVGSSSVTTTSADTTTSSTQVGSSSVTNSSTELSTSSSSVTSTSADVEAKVNGHVNTKQDRTKGNNGVGNGIDPQPPGNPPINDGPGTGPGNPGNKGGSGGATKKGTSGISQPVSDNPYLN